MSDCIYQMFATTVPFSSFKLNDFFTPRPSEVCTIVSCISEQFSWIERFFMASSRTKSLVSLNRKHNNVDINIMAPLRKNIIPGTMSFWKIERNGEYKVSVFWYQVYQAWLWERLLTSRGLLSDSICVLKAEPGKLDIKRRKPGILFISLLIVSLFKLTIITQFSILCCH